MLGRKRSFDIKNNTQIIDTNPVVAVETTASPAPSQRVAPVKQKIAGAQSVEAGA